MPLNTPTPQRIHHYVDEMKATLAYGARGGGAEAAQIFQGFLNSKTVKGLLGEMQEEDQSIYAGQTQQLVVDYQIVERMKEVVAKLKVRCSR